MCLRSACVEFVSRTRWFGGEMEEVTAFKALSPASFPNLIDQRFYQRRVNRSKIPDLGLFDRSYRFGCLLSY